MKVYVVLYIDEFWLEWIIKFVFGWDVGLFLFRNGVWEMDIDFRE